MTKRIVINGPECTGKSTLSRQLADHYNTLWVPEYARHYLLANGNEYTYPDLLEIAKMQVQTEDELASKVPGGTLIIDTDLYVMKVWCEFVFGRCHQWILDNIAKRHYDLYLLTYPDLPWVADDLREYPDHISRLKLFRIYHDNLINQHVPWHLISGLQHERFEKAVAAVDLLL